jgi:hypothetical protein
MLNVQLSLEVDKAAYLFVRDNGLVNSSLLIKLMRAFHQLGAHVFNSVLVSSGTSIQADVISSIFSNLFEMIDSLVLRGLKTKYTLSVSRDTTAKLTSERNGVLVDDIEVE